MPRQTYPSDEVDRLMLRFPDGMKGRVAQRAKNHFRSINAEIISILANVLDTQGTATTGNSLQAHPAVASEHAALQGSASIHQS